MSTPSSSHRSHAIDQLRGLVMIIMALDHARDFFTGFSDITNLNTTTPFLFATRWITHFCAPTFVFLAGMGIFLYHKRHTTQETTRFLWTRGLWLILLELTIIRFAWIPDPFYNWIPFGVIWVIGLSMLLMAVLVRLPFVAIFLVGAVVVVGHNALDSIRPQDWGSWAWLWNFLHQRGELLWGSRHLLIIYPLVPWFAVMALGYTAGTWMLWEPKKRQHHMMRWGLGLCAAFLLLRGFSVYGDPSSWTMQRDALYTFLSLLKTTKYPPSLQFLLMTLGPALLLLAFLDKNTKLPYTTHLTVFGRVPFFYYILHLYLLRFTALLCAFLVHGTRAIEPPPGPAGSPQWPIAISYLAWLLAVLLLYPLCVRFARKKATEKTWWLRYL